MLTQVKFKKLNPKAVIPQYKTSLAAGADLVACLDSPVEVIKPGETKNIPLGFATEFAPGHGALILPRSGISSKKSLAPINAPGLIDADYRGGWCVLLHNYSTEEQSVQDGERIAQVIFIEADTPQFTETEELSDTTRGTGGFGSTGMM